MYQSLIRTIVKVQNLNLNSKKKFLYCNFVERHRSELIGIFHFRMSSSTTSDDLLKKYNLQSDFLNRQTKFEEQLRKLNSENARKDAIFKYLKLITSNQPITYADFPKSIDILNSTQNKLSLESYKNHILVLDFFTYCCINCLHILPTLKKVESYYEHIDKFEVIGVHSAKFPNEKLLENVQDAVKRHNITHKVICDSQMTIWTQMCVNCWPTVLILGPNNQLIFILVGENNVIDWLHFYCESALQFFYPDLQIDNSDFIPKSGHKNPLSLYYPTKLSISPDNTRIAISDMGHNRIVVNNLNKELATSIGGLNSGNVDGGFESALFNGPQSCCWIANDRLLVADTSNHCLKLCSFDDDTVTTIAETKGVKEFSSPWDMCMVDSVIYIACAGSHTVFAFVIEDNVTVLNKTYNKYDLFKLAGTGLEENRNNVYPLKASFAQPSGICYSRKNKSLVIADSESSSIRTINLENGHVKNLAGGSKDPRDLFVFGDKDGSGVEARLQHPLGVCVNDKTNSVFVADTYNHKVKEIEFDSQECISIAGFGEPGNRSNCAINSALFNEPNDVVYSERENLLYVVDTNNHQIKLLKLDKNQVNTLKINFIKRITTETNNKIVKELPLLKVSKRNILSFKSNFLFSKDFRPSKGATHFFKLNILADKTSWFEISQNEISFTDFNNQPTIKVLFTEVAPHFTKFTLEGIVNVYYCSTTEEFCSFKEVTFKIPVIIDPHDIRNDCFNVDLTFELKV